MRNIGQIMMLGVCGTLLAMLVLSQFLSYANYYVLDQPILPAECLLLAAVLCATDTIAVLTLLSESKYPALNAVLFGEGLVNDSVAILLYRVVDSLLQSKKKVINNADGVIIVDLDLQAIDYIWISINFLTLALTSLTIGITIGLLASLTLKHLPHFNAHPVKEATLIGVSAYVAYIVAEYFAYSGIITLFSCGFTLSHYAYHNVSLEAQHGSRLMAETASYLAESFLYVYLGLSSLTIEAKYVDLSLIMVVLLGTIIARVISVMVPIAMLKTLAYIKGGKDHNTLQWNEALLIAIGGIIRGAIAFALAIQMTSKHAGLLRTTVQIIVLLTTVFLGSTVGLIAHSLNIKTNEDEDNYDN